MTLSYTTGNPNNLTGGTNASMNDIQGPFIDLRTYINGSIDETNLLAAVLDKLGLTSSTTTRRGFSSVATSETTTSLANVDLATVGPSLALTVPTNGLVIAAAQCDITNSVGGGTLSEADLMVDGVASSIVMQGSSTSVQTKGATVVGLTVAGAFLTAGSHTFKLQYKVSSASTGTFANRKLWVWTVGF